MNSEEINALAIRLDRIEAALQTLIRQHTVKEWYSTSKIAELLGRAEYTVREWCRGGRIRATKRHYARRLPGMDDQPRGTGPHPERGAPAPAEEVLTICRPALWHPRGEPWAEGDPEPAGT
jgi:hypothetical protein